MSALGMPVFVWKITSVSVPENRLDAAIASLGDLPYRRLGSLDDTSRLHAGAAIDLGVDALRDAWTSTFDWTTA